MGQHARRGRIHASVVVCENIFTGFTMTRKIRESNGLRKVRECQGKVKEFHVKSGIIISPLNCIQTIH